MVHYSMLAQYFENMEVCIQRLECNKSKFMQYFQAHLLTNMDFLHILQSLVCRSRMDEPDIITCFTRLYPLFMSRAVGNLKRVVITMNIISNVYDISIVK
jgi:hypothetical protein